ncbi:hemin ABC transporter substrate-binding protein [Roseibium sp. RKSG952]|uniref:heme/hemin ABC transporter substrate-binding protein n=1 Tax=Roseibium sp. RKSG952 TaxID=2529384 RepID=UPI0012BC991E|nr:ABC transporter substrate-binding protein [Roseibium sp. RKSG952]MTI02474.1 hemin ABC transporter substrate-binding protein [Roseibium sp. RKSG952]
MSMTSRFLNRTALFISLTFGAHQAMAEGTEANKIVSIGGSVTEIIYALGQQDRLVGRDRTSSYPQEASELPDVGYMRALTPEGVLSVAPDMIVSVEGSGPPEAIAVLREAGVEYVEVPHEFSRDGVVEKIRAVGAALGEEEAANALAEQVGAEIDAAHSAAIEATGSDRARVLFILSIQDGRIMVGGSGTQADSIISLAGGVNAAASFSGYKPISPEAMATAAPDVILMMDRQGGHATPDEELFQIPSIALTPAAQNKRLIRMQGLYLLGFGPRTANAISDLSKALQNKQGL